MIDLTEAPKTGPEAIEHALGKLDIDQLRAEHQGVIDSKKVSKRPRAVAVLNTLEGLDRNKLKPKDLMIHSIPVIPPAFRPFSVLGSTFVPGDANELYRDFMNIQDAHRDEVSTLGHVAASDSRLAVYDAAKALYGYGEPTSPKTKQRGVSGFLKTLTGSSPKFSFFQRKLLSKPMDNVSRGTIAVDPELGLDEIGVPKDHAWSAYAPYIQRRLVQSGMSAPDALKNVKERSEHAFKALEQEVNVRPMVYSRAPSWHKFNVLAGHPKLIDGDTISINPLVTTGLNADFDGDAMNLHVPSHPDAVKEAYEKLLPSKMLWSIRDQDKVVPLPKHEAILALFAANHRAAKKAHHFPSKAEALAAIRSGQVSQQDEVTFN
jgi:DNA-directed RNA polymerase subunit beta'